MKHTMKLGIVAGVITLLLSPATGKAYSLIPLTGDASQSSTPYDHTAADGLSYTLNDPFAYNPASPTSPLPQQSYYVANRGFHGNTPGPVTVAYTFGGIYSGFFFDLYGRTLDDGAGVQFRDNGLTLKLYNGDWVTPVFTSAPFDIPDSAPYFFRFDTPTGNISADRVSITGPAYFTLMEIRAAVPEPSTALLAVVGGAFMLRRRRGGS